MLFFFLADMSYLIIQPVFLRLSPAPGDVTHCLGKRFTGSTFQSLWFHVGWERRADGERSGEFLMRIFRVGAASGDVRRRLHLCHPVTDIKYPPELDWRRSINHKCVLLLQQQKKFSVSFSFYCVTSEVLNWISLKCKFISLFPRAVISNLLTFIFCFLSRQKWS